MVKAKKKNRGLREFFTRAEPVPAPVSSGAGLEPTVHAAATGLVQGGGSPSPALAGMPESAAANDRAAAPADVQEGALSGAPAQQQADAAVDPCDNVFTDPDRADTVIDAGVAALHRFSSVPSAQYASRSSAGTSLGAVHTPTVETTLWCSSSAPSVASRIRSARASSAPAAPALMLFAATK